MFRPIKVVDNFCLRFRERERERTINICKTSSSRVHDCCFSANLFWVANSLWTFVSRHVTKSFRKSMRSLANGEELNGLELQRFMWIKHEGGAADIEFADFGALHTFPQCQDPSALQQYLGEWLALVQEHCQDLLARHLTPLLTKMLPAEVRADVKR